MQRSAARYAPQHLFVIIDVKTAFVLKNSNHPFFLWPQVWFDVRKANAFGFPLYHARFVRCHQWEEHIVPIFDDIWPFMAIHVNPFLHPRVPPSEQEKPSLCRALRQPICEVEPERWEDALVEGLMELFGGHFARRHTRKMSPRRRLYSLIL